MVSNSGDPKNLIKYEERTLDENDNEERELPLFGTKEKHMRETKKVNLYKFLFLCVCAIK